MNNDNWGARARLGMFIVGGAGALGAMAGGWAGGCRGVELAMT